MFCPRKMGCRNDLWVQAMVSSMFLTSQYLGRCTWSTTASIRVLPCLVAFPGIVLFFHFKTICSFPWYGPWGK